MREKTVSAILAHAAASFPEECCGVVIQKGRVEKFIPCKNQAESPTEQFELNPEDYAVAEEQGTVVAIVHSHPGDGATTQPSELDMLMCDATELPPIIASWPEGDIRTVMPRGDRPSQDASLYSGMQTAGLSSWTISASNTALNCPTTA